MCLQYNLECVCRTFVGQTDLFMSEKTYLKKKIKKKKTVKPQSLSIQHKNGLIVYRHRDKDLSRRVSLCQSVCLSRWKCKRTWSPQAIGVINCNIYLFPEAIVHLRLGPAAVPLHNQSGQFRSWFDLHINLYFSTKISIKIWLWKKVWSITIPTELAIWDIMSDYSLEEPPNLSIPSLFQLAKSKVWS